MADENSDAAHSARIEFEREKWVADLRLREEELNLKRIEVERSRWNNPLAIAILAAAVAGIANAGVAWLNGYLQRTMETERSQQESKLEEQKSTDTLALDERRSEATRILEVIKIGDPDKAAVNLQFLLDAGLLSKDTAERVATYLRGRKPGQGAVLPEPSSSLRTSQLPTPSDFTDPSKVRMEWICGAEKIQLKTLRDLLADALRTRYPKATVMVHDMNKIQPIYIIGIADKESLQAPHNLAFFVDQRTKRVVIVLDESTENWGFDKDLTIVIDKALNAIMPVCEFVEDQKR